MNRSEIRKAAFELIYSLEIQKIDKEEYEEQIQFFLENRKIEDEKVIAYIKDAVWGVEEHKEEIQKQIKQELSDKWELNRLSKISIATLELAIYEILYNKLPYKVVINEAVEIAKIYGDDNAPSFINGVLASVVKNNNIE